MKCEKCQDVGIIDLDKAGIFSKFCDCEVGKAILEKKRAIYGIPEDNNPIEVATNDSNDRAEPDNPDTGSGDTSESKQPSKPKKKKKARKRAK